MFDSCPGGKDAALSSFSIELSEQLVLPEALGDVDELLDRLRKFDAVHRRFLSVIELKSAVEEARAGRAHAAPHQKEQILAFFQSQECRLLGALSQQALPTEDEFDEFVC